MPLTVIATITAEAGKEEALKPHLIGLVEPTRAEDGCIRYELHQDNENPTLFTFNEMWESQAHLAAHANSEHVAAYRIASKGMAAGFEMRKLTQVI